MAHLTYCVTSLTLDVRVFIIYKTHHLLTYLSSVINKYSDTL